MGLEEENGILSALNFQLVYVQVIHNNLVFYCHILGFSVFTLKG